MHNNIDALYSALWQNYVQITPSAKRIHKLLAGEENSPQIVNDHVAFRTFNLDKTRLSHLAEHFLALGYEAKGDYDFKAKKVTAKHYEHPDKDQPKVFISELRVEEFSPQTQHIIESLVEQMPASVVSADNFLYSGRHWQLSKQEYQSLATESEYASWLAAWGYRANHFTVSVNHLSNLSSLADVNTLLKEAGFVLNTSGGEIKGGEAVHLAQSSTMADQVELEFSDGVLTIPSCFYEFAQRYHLPNGELYQGFVEASADKIFESTNSQ